MAPGAFPEGRDGPGIVHIAKIRSPPCPRSWVPPVPSASAPWDGAVDQIRAPRECSGMKEPPKNLGWSQGWSSGQYKGSATGFQGGRSQVPQLPCFPGCVPFLAAKGETRGNGNSSHGNLPLRDLRQKPFPLFPLTKQCLLFLEWRTESWNGVDGKRL